MSHVTLPESEMTSAFVATQLKLQGIHLNDDDLLQTTRHYQLLCSHAERVMGLFLDEHIEPAPEFRP